jgi:regulator of sigma E protease
MVLHHQAPFTQVRDSVRTTFATLGALISPKSSVSAGHMSGPIQIMSIYHKLFTLENGWKLVLWFSVLLNINLAILNLLPFPVLDGGHIVMAIGEWMRGKPVKGKILEYVQAGCAMLLLGFMLFITLKDIGGLGSDRTGEGKKPAFDPPPAGTGEGAPEPAKNS